ncbi:MAG: OmpA family protein [Saprospiraceae bacterium]
MTRRFNFMFVLTLAFAMCATTLMAQPLVSDQSSDDGISSLTKDPKAYSPKPKDMWELGVHAGYLGVAGDTPFRIPFAGVGGGASIRKSLGYTFSLRADFLIGNSYGFDYAPYWAATEPVGILTGNLDGNGNGYTQNNPYVYNFKTTYTSVGIQALYNFTNIKFHSTAPKLGLYGILGLSGFSVNTFYDAKDANGNIYDFATLLGPDILARKAGTIDNAEYRTRAGDILSQNLDGDYETAAAFQNISGEEIAIGFALQSGIGLAYRVSDRLSIAVEPQVHISSNDYIDGRAMRSKGQPSAGSDVPFYIPVRLNFHLGDPKKKSIPLWWVNPLDGTMDAIAKNTAKKDAAEMLADKDNDGVPNIIDKEPDTPAGAEVDTRGVTLDSDKDGLPNHLDKEPYSPVGYKIDPQTGISEKPKMPKTMSKEEVLAIGKNAGWDKPATTSSSMNDWFLPMIHFDNDRYTIKPQSYSALGEVAAVMKKYPSISVVVEGHASSEASANYNKRLSYRRANAAVNALVNDLGISRSRLILTYTGESDPLIKSNTTNYMNRRVEFRVSNGETEMSAPN